MSNFEIIGAHYRGVFYMETVSKGTKMEFKMEIILKKTTEIFGLCSA